MVYGILFLLVWDCAAARVNGLLLPSRKPADTKISNFYPSAAFMDKTSPTSTASFFAATSYAPPLRQFFNAEPERLSLLNIVISQTNEILYRGGGNRTVLNWPEAAPFQLSAVVCSCENFHKEATDDVDANLPLISEKKRETFLVPNDVLWENSPGGLFELELSGDYDITVAWFKLDNRYVHFEEDPGLSGSPCGCAEAVIHGSINNRTVLRLIIHHLGDTKLEKPDQGFPSRLNHVDVAIEGTVVEGSSLSVEGEVAETQLKCNTGVAFKCGSGGETKESEKEIEWMVVWGVANNVYDNRSMGEKGENAVKKLLQKGDGALFMKNYEVTEDILSVPLYDIRDTWSAGHTSRTSTIPLPTPKGSFLKNVLFCLKVKIRDAGEGPSQTYTAQRAHLKIWTGWKYGLTYPQLLPLWCDISYAVNDRILPTTAKKKEVVDTLENPVLDNHVLAAMYSFLGIAIVFLVCFTFVAGRVYSL